MEEPKLTVLVPIVKDWFRIFAAAARAVEAGELVPAGWDAAYRLGIQAMHEQSIPSLEAGLQSLHASGKLRAYVKSRKGQAIARMLAEDIRKYEATFGDEEAAAQILAWGCTVPTRLAERP